MMKHSKVRLVIDELFQCYGGELKVEPKPDYVVYKAIFKNRREMSNIDLTVAHWTIWRQESENVPDVTVYETGDAYYKNHAVGTAKVYSDIIRMVTERINAPAPSEAGVN